MYKGDEETSRILGLRKPLFIDALYVTKKQFTQFSRYNLKLAPYVHRLIDVAFIGNFSMVFCYFKIVILAICFQMDALGGNVLNAVKLYSR